jgi:hypothetical protein
MVIGGVRGSKDASFGFESRGISRKNWGKWENTALRNQAS